MTSMLHGKSIRRSRIPVWAVGLLVVASLLSACGRRNDTPTSGEILTQYLPSDWTAVESAQGFQEINIDEAGPNKETEEADEPEWLYFFHYDSPSDEINGPIGGIIYDAQQGTELYNPDVTIPFPFQPTAFFVPYRLLPDWVEGKGQGYLGDTDVTWEQTTLLGEGGIADELLVLGKGPGGGVTRITIFRWLGKTKGYGVSYFYGSYSAAIVGERVLGTAVQQVQTLNALDDRSVLCEKTVWTREGNTDTFSASPPAIVFCLGTPPPQPMYPEAVVLAYLLNGNIEMVLPDSRDEVRAVVPAGTNRVVTLAYPGTAALTGTGVSAVSQMIVETLIENSQGQSRVKWSLREQRPTAAEKTTRWRIVSAEKG